MELSDGGGEDGLQNRELVALWLSHTDKMWRTVYSTPVFASAIVFGWYSTIDSHTGYSVGIAALGVTIMVMQLLIIGRMSDYDQAFFEPIKAKLTSLPPKRRLRGRVLALLVPCVLLLTHLVMLVISINLSSDSAS